MQTIKNLKGCGTALVTPFKADQKIDEAAFDRAGVPTPALNKKEGFAFG